MSAPTWLDRECAEKCRAAESIEAAAQIVAEYLHRLIAHDRRQSQALIQGYRALAESRQQEIEELRQLSGAPAKE